MATTSWIHGSSTDSRGRGFLRYSRRFARRVDQCAARGPGYGYACEATVLSPSDRYLPLTVGAGLLQEARAKLARPTVKSARPGLTAGAFAFRGVRTRFCDKGLRARRSLGVGQRGGVAERLADPRGGLAGLSLLASRDLSVAERLCLTLTAGLCLQGHNRGLRPRGAPAASAHAEGYEVGGAANGVGT